MYSPVDWPVFELNGTIVEALKELGVEEAVDASETADWYWNMELAGQDSYLHLRPCHAAAAMQQLLEAQLRLGETTAFTVVVPAVGMREWRKYLKHFRRKEVHKVAVPGLGEVKHWLLRFEAGDGRLQRGSKDDQSEEDE